MYMRCEHMSSSSSLNRNNRHIKSEIIQKNLIFALKCLLKMLLPVSNDNACACAYKWCHCYAILLLLILLVRYIERYYIKSKRERGKKNKQRNGYDELGLDEPESETTQRLLQQRCGAREVARANAPARQQQSEQAHRRRARRVCRLAARMFDTCPLYYVYVYPKCDWVVTFCLLKWEKLSLANNHLVEIRPLAKLTHLVVVNLAGNSLCRLDNLRELSRLAWLNVADNQLQVSEHYS